jgi:uncharacterized protein
MARLRVEVVYALRAGADCVAITLPAGATARDAVESSGLLARHPEIVLGRHKLGVFGKVVAPGAALKDGDRVEIYRPLQIDVKEARRQRALRKPLRKR